jgi:uncharacterized protein (TIGR02266 family)
MEIQEDKKTGVYCPYCTKEIPLTTTECPWCCVVYDPDTLNFLKLMAYQAEKEHPSTNRKLVRFPKTLRVTYPTRKAFEEALTSNVSLGGLFINTPRPLNQGEKVNLKIFLPHEAKELDAVCEVVWSRNEANAKAGGNQTPGMGVKFLSLSREATDRFIGVLSRKVA